MILFSGLSRFSGHYGDDGPSPLNRDTTVLNLEDSTQKKDKISMNSCFCGKRREKALSRLCFYRLNMALFYTFIS